MSYSELIKAATEARKNAYAPYSGYAVGAAVLTKNHKIFSGCNVESAAYSPTICAERLAILKAVSEGERSFEAIALVAAPMEIIDNLPDMPTPCGVCLQVLSEFCDDDFIIILAKGIDEYEQTTLKTLLPRRFGKDDVLSFKEVE